MGVEFVDEGDVVKLYLNTQDEKWDLELQLDMKSIGRLLDSLKGESKARRHTILIGALADAYFVKSKKGE